MTKQNKKDHNKRYALMRDIVVAFHPDFQSPEMRRSALSNPEFYDIEHLVELTMAHLGPYHYVDEGLYDNSDFSDTKTGSISPNSYQSPNSFLGAIGGIMTKGGNVKIGALRIVIYNPHLDCLSFYYLPKSVWDPGMREYGDANKSKLRFTWNKKTNSIVKFAGYEMPSFKALAMATDENYKELQQPQTITVDVVDTIDIDLTNISIIG